MLKNKAILILIFINTVPNHCKDEPIDSPFEAVTKLKSFIDKTLLMRMFFLSAKEIPESAFQFISCPRLGKSVNLDMMKRFLETHSNSIGKKKANELFTNPTLKLEVARDMFGFNRHFGRYFVVFFNFSATTDAKTTDEILNSIIGEIRKAYESYRWLYDKKFSKSRYNDEDEYRQMFEKMYSREVGFDFSKSLKILTDFLYECDHKKEIFLLVDDYDMPLKMAIKHNANLSLISERVETLLTQLMGNIRFAIITSSSIKNRNLEKLNKLYVYQEVLNSKYTRPINYYFGFRSSDLKKLYELYNVHPEEREMIEERFGQLKSVYYPEVITNYLETRNLK